MSTAPNKSFFSQSTGKTVRQMRRIKRLYTFYKMQATRHFPLERTRYALSFICPSALFFFALFSRCDNTLAEKTLWALLSFASLMRHVDNDGRFSLRLNALCFMFLGMCALCTFVRVRRIYGAWVAIWACLTPPPPFMWLINHNIRVVEKTGIVLFTLVDLVAQSNIYSGSIHTRRTAFVLFLWWLRVRASKGEPSAFWRLMANLILAKHISDARRWMDW